MGSPEGKSFLVLGGGFGGLTAATELRSRLGTEHRITLIDRKTSFFMGLTKLWVLSGARRLGEGHRDLRLLESRGIEVVTAEILRLDTASKSVTTSDGVRSFDYLIIALGAELAVDRPPGATEARFNLYDIQDVARLHAALERFREGRVVIAIAALPFRCPPAPYEAAFLIDAMLRERGVRDRVHLEIHTPEKQPVPAAGPDAGGTVRQLLDERGIMYGPGHALKEVDGSRRTARFDDGSEIDFDLLAVVPPHVLPAVLRGSGLAGPMGWIPVDPRTLRTSVPDVYAVGDNASVLTATGLLIPRAGILAEEEAKVVAHNLAAEVQGKSDRVRFEGRGYCIMEVGGGRAAAVEGEFLAEPVPKVTLSPPSVEALERKRAFEAERLKRWFGS